MKIRKTVDLQHAKDILKHSESNSRKLACTNSNSAIGVLHSNKSVTGVEDPSSGRSSNKPKSPQPVKPADPPDWSRLVPEFMRKREKLSPQQMIDKFMTLTKKTESAKSNDWWLSEEGQKLQEMEKERDATHKGGLNIFDYSTATTASLCPS